MSFNIHYVLSSFLYHYYIAKLRQKQHRDAVSAEVFFLPNHIKEIADKDDAANHNANKGKQQSACHHLAEHNQGGQGQGGNGHHQG